MKQNTLREEIFMFDTRKKATMPQMLADIKLYLTKRFLSEPVIDDRCLPVICQVLLRRYSNVKLVQGVTDNKPNLRIRVEGALFTKERSFEVVHTGGRKKDDLRWIDRVEEMDAVL